MHTCTAKRFCKRTHSLGCMPTSNVYIYICIYIYIYIRKPCGTSLQSVPCHLSESIHAYIHTRTTIITLTHNHPGKCQDRPCSYVATLFKMFPADCLAPDSCHVICARAGWCIHDSSDGDQGMLRPRYKGTQCQCPKGVFYQV